MNGRKAKNLRKKIYGNFALRNTKYERHTDGSIHCTGRRKIYQEAKRFIRRLIGESHGSRN